KQPSILLCERSCCLSAAQQDGGVCYILDGILIVYGIVLTVLYCRLKFIGAQMPSSNIKHFYRHFFLNYESLPND
uniref:Fc receptor, IgE, high affinity I, gamma polypeptide like n=1 Tax=Sinocyclocheilus grahami TaxID=75366 RepID=A0A672RH91_SINGR